MASNRWLNTGGRHDKGIAIVRRHHPAIGSDLGIPKVDVDKLVETHRKNFEAFTQTVLVASNGVKSLATKQKQMIDTASVALTMARKMKPSGDQQQTLAKQSEMARMALDAAIDHTRQIADQVSESSAEALEDRQRQGRGEHRRDLREL